MIFGDLWSGYGDTGSVVKYEFMITTGVYDSVTKKFTFSNTQDLFEVTPKRIIDDIDDNLNDLRIELAGYTGAIIDDVKMNVVSKPGHLGNTASKFGAALIIITDWKIWDKD